MARKEVIQIRCSEMEKTKWMDAAASQGVDFSVWARTILDKASHRTMTVGQQTQLDAISPSEDSMVGKVGRPVRTDFK